MAGFSLAGRARADIESIADYTRTQWGAEQARLYHDILHNTFRELAANPAMGKKRPEFRKTIRAFPAGSHVVYYQQTDFGILVLRVLHQRQDPFRHF